MADEGARTGDGAGDAAAPVPTDRPVVFVGSATLDAIALVDCLPGRDQRVVASELVLAGGGPAATAAVTFARLGLPAAFVGTVGDDPAGRQVRDGLVDEGVDVSGLQVVAGAATGASVITVEREHGTRTICTRAVPAPTVAPGSVGARLVAEAGWVHVDHLGWSSLRDLPPTPGRRLSLDAGNPVRDLDLARVDLYAPTVERLLRDLGLPPGTPVGEALGAALAAGAGTVVATRGADGSVAAAAGGAHVATSGHHVDVVSTLGAGDVFHGALLAAVVRGLPLAQACRYAGVVAALSCRGLDGRSAVPDHAAVLALLPDGASDRLPDRTTSPTAGRTSSTGRTTTASTTSTGSRP